MTVVHHPRVAWEGARAFVNAADDNVYWWLGDMVGRSLGVTHQTRLSMTRVRLQREDAWPAETAAWRVRLEEMLDERPDLAPVVLQLVTETSRRLSR
ncbi:hypothetical protein [Streptosporangium sp. NPDC048865]|uniref:hypothetical protein n=1 Tax=Streptosporangium sp. NPDC048865 TaxID=3155766 RepID=UPI00342050E7